MWILAIVFASVFLITALGLVAVSRSGNRELKRTKARLEAISMGARADLDEQEMLNIRREEMLSSLPWLDRLLLRVDLAPRLKLLLYQANLKWSVGRLCLLAVLLAAVAGYLVEMRTGAALLSLALAAVAGSLPLAYVLRRRARRFLRLEQQLPEALDMMVAAIRAGHGFASAMGMVAHECPEPLRGEFRQCFDEQNFGLELRTAMLNLAQRVPLQDVRLIVTAVLIQKDSGGNLTEILEKAALLIRDRFRLHRQIRVHTAQGRLTGLILALLPVVLGVLLYLVNPEHMSVLWKRPVGVKLVYGAAVLTLLGGLIIRKIVRIRV